MRDSIQFDSTLVVIYAVLAAVCLVFLVVAALLRRRRRNSGVLEPLWAFRLRRLTFVGVAVLDLLGMAVPLAGLPLQWTFYIFMGAVGVGLVSVAVLRSLPD